MSERSARLPRENFGQLLKRYRSSLGVSQEDLAESANVSAAAISALERGARRAPYRETVTLLANALLLTESDRNELELAAERARSRTKDSLPQATSAHNLPLQLTSFIGRAATIGELSSSIGKHRLVTHSDAALAALRDEGARFSFERATEEALK